MKKALLKLAIAAAGIVSVSLAASFVVPPASAGQPLTLYVDKRIGSDDDDGRTPERALETLNAALTRAEPGADILLTGYSDQLRYRGTGADCVTLRGTPDQPITIRRNVYTNTLYPAVITADRLTEREWARVRTERGQTTWSTPWPRRIALSGDPDLGFLKVGKLALTGFIGEPPLAVGDASWWADGELYVRTADVDPNQYPVLVKDGDGLCLSADSRHVRIKDLSFHGAVHAIRVEDGAIDVEIEHVVRHNVLDPDLIAPSAGGKGIANQSGAEAEPGQ